MGKGKGRLTRSPWASSPGVGSRGQDILSPARQKVKFPVHSKVAGEARHSRVSSDPHMHVVACVYAHAHMYTREGRWQRESHKATEPEAGNKAKWLGLPVMGTLKPIGCSLTQGCVWVD